MGVKTNGHRKNRGDKVIIYNKKSEKNIKSCKEAVDALQEQLNLVKTIFNATPDSFVFKDRKFVYRNVNSAFCKFLNKSEEEIVGKTDFDLFPPSEAELYRLDDEKVMETGALLIQDEEVVKEQGTEWLQVAKIPIFDEGGRCVGLVCTVHDITDRKHAEEALKESEEKYRSLIEGLDEAVYRMSVPGGEYEYFSPSAQTVFGYSKETFINNPLLIKRIIHPDFADYFKETWKDLQEGRVPSTYTYKIVDPEGNERWIRQSNKAVFDNQGTVIAIEGLCRNITQRKQTGKALQESEEKFRLFFEEEPDYCYMISPEGKILDANKSALQILGYTKEEIVGKPLLTAVYAPSSREKAKALFLKWKQTGSLRNEELNIRTKDGQERTVLLSVDSVRDAEENMLHSVSVQRDITERKKVEEQIKASLREKEILLQEIHHRVKNNMQVVSSLLNLQAEFIKDRKVLQVFKDSQTRIQSMALVHEELYQSDDLANINLDEYVRDLAVYVFQSYASNSEIALTVDVEDISLGIDTAIPFGLIINELVSDCLKHAFPDGRKGEIRIQLRSRHDYVALTVADNGVGMPEDVDFKNAESLGLSLVTILAEDQLEGDVSLDRSGGTEVRITFKRLPRG